MRASESTIIPTPERVNAAQSALGRDSAGRQAAGRIAESLDVIELSAEYLAVVAAHK